MAGHGSYRGSRDWSTERAAPALSVLLRGAVQSRWTFDVGEDGGASSPRTFVVRRNCPIDLRGDRSGSSVAVVVA